MTIGEFSVALYAIFWIVRINGFVRRSREPLMRGTEWFFDVPVPAGFYAGTGRAILRRYRLRLLVPFAIDVPIAAAIFAWGNVTMLNALIVALSVAIHAGHAMAVDRAEREARRFEDRHRAVPSAGLGVSLATRRVRDYSHPAIEALVALLAVVTFAWLAARYLGSSPRPDVGYLFGTPVLLLYLQAGMLYAKWVAIEWRMPLPREGAARYRAVREIARKHLLALIDWSRIVAAVSFLYWPMVVSAAPEEHAAVVGLWFVLWTVAGIGGTVWAEVRRKRLKAVLARTRPVRLPDLLGQSELARWPVCCQPGIPLLVLKGTRGYSLNLAHRLALVGGAYLAGFAALLWLIRFAGH
jgi:hypothetical protein